MPPGPPPAPPPPFAPPPARPRAPAAPPPAECGAVRRAARVYYGTEQPTYVPLSAGQILAVGTFGGCSGALVAPTWVLPAAHCGLSGGTEVCMGTDPDDAAVGPAAAGAINTPGGDMTLVELDEDARARLPQVVPISIVTEDLGPAWIGRTAEAAGYGQTESGGYGTRRFTAEPIARLGGDVLTIDGHGMRGVCFGDSGGPVMVIAADGTVRVAGDLSNGDGSCVGQEDRKSTRLNSSPGYISYAVFFF